MGQIVRNTCSVPWADRPDPKAVNLMTCRSRKTKLELVINPKPAKALGVIVPPGLLEVIE